MATAAPTRNTPILTPPSTDSGVLGWVRKNLFGSVFDTILTLLAIGFICCCARSSVGSLPPVGL